MTCPPPRGVTPYLHRSREAHRSATGTSVAVTSITSPPAIDVLRAPVRLPSAPAGRIEARPPPPRKSLPRKITHALTAITAAVKNPTINTKNPASTAFKSRMCLKDPPIHRKVADKLPSPPAAPHLRQPSEILSIPLILSKTPLRPFRIAHPSALKLQNHPASPLPSILILSLFPPAPILIIPLLKLRP
jgi:hypothetical protein